MRSRTITLLIACATAAVVASRLQARRRDHALPAWEPRVLQQLARWCPPDPRTPVGRLASVIWATPLTTFGLVVGAVAGTRPARRGRALVFAGARGLPAAALRWRGFSAATLGHVIIAVGEPSDRLLQHELTHVRQCERLGPVFVPLYLGLLVVYGYRQNPFERAARLCAAGAQPVRRDRDSVQLG